MAVDEVRALAEAILQAADVAGLGVTASYDQGGALRFVYVSEAAARIVDQRAEDLLGQPMSVVFAPPERSRLEDLSNRLRRGESIANLIEAVGLRKSGAPVPIEVAFSVVALAGEPAVVAFVRDIGERKQAEARLALTERLATLGRLAAGVAHEINNPIGYVALSIESIAHELERVDTSTSPHVALALASAREGVARVATIVRDLLRLSAANGEERWPVDVRAVLESAINVAMHAIRGRAQIVRRYADVPALKTDPARLGQILLNLLFNAVQSFPSDDEEQNQIALDIGHAPPNHVAIRIADNGCGIEARDLARIFDPFYTTKEVGTGLGLAICHSLVTSLGGRIDVDSAPGIGSAFTVVLPAMGDA